MGQITATRNLVATKVVRHAGQSPASPLFTQPFIEAQIKENIKAPRHWLCVWGIHRWPVNSPHKWPVTRKMFPFDDVSMCMAIPTWRCRNIHNWHHVCCWNPILLMWNTFCFASQTAKQMLNSNIKTPLRKWMTYRVNMSNVHLLNRNIHIARANSKYGG